MYSSWVARSKPSTGNLIFLCSTSNEMASCSVAILLAKPVNGSGVTTSVSPPSFVVTVAPFIGLYGEDCRQLPVSVYCLWNASSAVCGLDVTPAPVQAATIAERPTKNASLPFVSDLPARFSTFLNNDSDIIYIL